MSFTKNNWYNFEGIEQLDTPALVIYLDRVKHNIHKLITGIDDINRLRPHIKTHKNKEITLLMLQAGITKFKCATIAEAELLGLCNCKDVLLAYQPVGPKLERFMTLIHTYKQTNYSCLVDNLISAQLISAAAKQHELNITVYLDLNVGMNRTGINCDHHAVELYDAIAQLPNVTIAGLHAYDGHVTVSDIEARTSICEGIFAQVSAIKDQLVTMGYEPTLIMGGSPSYSIYANQKDCECSPGTFIFWDQSYLEIVQEQEFLPAALVLGRVISKPAHRKISIDIGHKSVAAENPLKLRMKVLNAPYLEIVGHSEEHMMLLTEENDHFQIGDVLYGLPMHICPTCALYEQATIVENGKIIDHWDIIARNRTISL